MKATFIKRQIERDGERKKNYEIGDKIKHKNMCSSCAHILCSFGWFMCRFIFVFVLNLCVVNSHDWLIDCLN